MASFIVLLGRDGQNKNLSCINHFITQLTHTT